MKKCKRCDKPPRFNESNGFVSSQRSSSLMRRIKTKDSTPEILLRKALWKMGLRYKIHCEKVIGIPDIAFPSKRIAIFVDGDFWHGYNWEKKKKSLKTNRGFWIPKIERTIQRDKEVTLALINARWCVIRIWEHEVKTDLDNCIKRILFFINEEEVLE
jgi:DNA mismatch endonuclease (patch repair protein)